MGLGSNSNTQKRESIKECKPLLLFVGTDNFCRGLKSGLG